MSIVPLPPPGTRTVTERPDGSSLHVHPGWQESFPWLVQGITGSDADMSLFSRTPAGEVIPRWQDLRKRLGCRSMVHARQVHRAAILLHDTLPEGLIIAPDADGHVTRQPGTLLAVSVADCVPIFIAGPAARAVAMLHGGWRGVAAGILEQGIRLLTASFPVEPGDLHVHFGPAICGECFEVGPEVPEGLAMEERQGVTHVDLRALLAHRAVAVGVRAAQISISAYCTRHGHSPFYSHRGGCAERQIGVLGVRAV